MKITMEADSLFKTGMLPDLDNGSIIISNRTSLTIISFTMSTIGIVLSSIALVLLIVTAILFAEWRRNYKNQLLIQFMLARFFFTLARYFYDVTKVFDINLKNEQYCDVNLLILFYTEMALVSWMVVFTKQMYDSLVKLFTFGYPRLWIVSLATWLTPCVCATTFFIIYILQFYQIRLYITYLLVLKLPIIIIIAILLIRTMKSIISVNKSNTEKNARILVVMVGLIFMFCVQQVVVDIYKLVAIIIMKKMNKMPDIVQASLVVFNICAIYHCALSIMFWLFGNAPTRKLWKFERKQ